MSDDLARHYEQRDGAPPVIDTSIAHSARVYDYVLGGKDNYPVDREAAEQMLNGWPQLRTSMQENRKFMHRAVRCAAEQGIDQFIDIGTGIPTSPNLHEIVQAVTPSARVVYVDKDPIVFAHAAARLTGTPEGRISYLLADMSDAEAILGSPEVTGTLDLDRPVALSIIAVLQFVLDQKAAYELVRGYMDRLAPGSLLTITTVTSDTAPVPAGDGDGRVHQARTSRSATARGRGRAVLRGPGPGRPRCHPDPPLAPGAGHRGGRGGLRGGDVRGRGPQAVRSSRPAGVARKP